MIKIDGKKVSAKTKAEELLAIAIDQVVEGYWTDKETDLTEKEIEKINAQIEKISQRIYKLLNAFEE